MLKQAEELNVETSPTHGCQAADMLRRLKLLIQRIEQLDMATSEYLKKVRNYLCVRFF
jgi:hypothetical protein